ncbi:hypothetical protein [Halalkalibacter sp. APA_J-10(15)]|uniref:hypothetical protein n=1 Tax=Halalkalibacter sp. APA_J-10(15) TaxID=2933805 RepID=UPI001FF4567E|nr:hypothetical protein [Halalkalibacter sp. APA_J-10(15)]MCK0470859.1 hypothetical protein [Halalkalibacter sp. APA_J-10(15)]
MTTTTQTNTTNNKTTYTVTATVTMPVTIQIKAESIEQAEQMAHHQLDEIAFMGAELKLNMLNGRSVEPSVEDYHVDDIEVGVK